MKRVVSVFLAILMSFTILMQPVMAADANNVDMEAVIRKQIEDYGASVDVDNARTAGVTKLLTQFAFGNGKDLVMGEGDAVTALIANSVVFQEAMVATLTKLAESGEESLICPEYWYYSESLGKDARGGSEVHYYNSNASGYSVSTGYRQPYIQRTYIKDSMLNSYDEALILVAGAMYLQLEAQLISSNENELVYHVDVLLDDEFDFGTSNDEYDKIFKDGDASLAKLLTTVGNLMALGFCDEFKWEVSMDFDITVPNIHPWPEFDWAEDHSSCNATLTTEEEVFSGECAVETQTIAASCTAEGKTIYTASVELNGRTYSDIKEEILPKINHDYQSAVTAPTCTESGYTTHTCTVCGDSYTDSAVEANGHSYNSVVTAPTCTESGYTTHTCAVCGDSYTDSQVVAKGHSYNPVVTAPTCTESGYTTHTCNVCGDSYTDTPVAANGHTYVKGVCVVCGAEDESYHVLLGDVNGDETVNNIDAMRVLQYVVGLISNEEIDAESADVNGDGSVNNIDAMLILQLAVGLIAEFSTVK